MILPNMQPMYVHVSQTLQGSITAIFMSCKTNLVASEKINFSKMRQKVELWGTDKHKDEKRERESQELRFF